MSETVTYRQRMRGQLVRAKVLEFIDPGEELTYSKVLVQSASAWLLLVHLAGM
jgi:hypothetical protein